MKIDSPEFSLLILCCRKEMDDDGRRELKIRCEQIDDWRVLSKLALRHRTEGFVLRHAGNFLPPDVHEELRSQCENTVRKNLALTAELIQLLKQLEEKGITGIPYKGPVLMQQVYGDVGLRPTHDIDLMIDPAHRDLCEAIASDRGFVTTTGTSSFGRKIQNWMEKDSVWFSQEKRINLEIHWRFTDWYHSFPLHGRSFRKGLREWEWSGHTFHLMPKEETLLTLAFHGSLHQWPRLEMLAMASEFCRQSDDLDWDRLQNLATPAGARRPLWLALLLVHRHFDVELPPSILALAEADPVIPRLIEKVEHNLCAEEINIPLLDELDFDLGMLATRMARLRYLFGQGVISALRPFTGAKSTTEEVVFRSSIVAKRHSLSFSNVFAILSKLLHTK